MGLVDYSTEESGAEDSPAPVSKPTPNTKPSFQKVVDKSAPTKIKVDLSSASRITGPTDDVSEPPAKRPRLGAGGGFNSFLPAAKNPVASKSAQSANGRGKVVSLKTGPEAAFSREPMPPPSHQSEDDSLSNAKDPVKTGSQEAESTVSIGTDSAPPQPKGKTTMFRPLSVSRKPTKKKAASVLVAQPSMESMSANQSAQTPTSMEAPPKPKAKVSLFSMNAPEASPDAFVSEASEYQPLLYGTESESAKENSSFSEVHHVALPLTNQTVAPPAGSNTLGAIADDLHLTASQRRQLFGRGGKDPAFAASASAMNVTNFNMDREYAANEELRAAGETPEQQHKAVRTVNTSGRNSLRSLVNVVASQGEALEEHFAQGKRNKSEAGSKYGW